MANTRPEGQRRALSQSQHEDWNASNYPGTRLLCSNCDEPTGRCEEDSLTTNKGDLLCESCWLEEQLPD